jgi:hypothetical protein
VPYTAQSIDTSIESDRFFFQLLRQRSPLQRLEMAAAMMREARKLSLLSLRASFSTLSGCVAKSGKLNEFKREKSVQRSW